MKPKDKPWTDEMKKRQPERMREIDEQGGGPIEKGVKHANAIAEGLRDQGYSDREIAEKIANSKTLGGGGTGFGGPLPPK